MDRHDINLNTYNKDDYAYVKDIYQFDKGLISMIGVDFSIPDRRKEGHNALNVTLEMVDGSDIKNVFDRKLAKELPPARIYIHEDDDRYEINSLREDYNDIVKYMDVALMHYKETLDKCSYLFKGSLMDKIDKSIPNKEPELDIKIPEFMDDEYER